MSEKFYFVNGRSVFVADTVANTVRMLFNCKISNINQVMMVAGGAVIKNTSGHIAKFTLTGHKIWSVNVGNSVCTDDDFVYDSITDKIIFFCYSHKTKCVWLVKLDGQTGNQCKELFFEPQSSGSKEVKMFCALKAENGIMTYVETINNLDINRAITRVYRGYCLIWQSYGFLAGAKRINGDKYYNYSLFYDLGTQEIIHFADKEFALPIYQVINYRNGYCLTVCENGTNKLIITDKFFNKQAEKIISDGPIFCVNDYLYLVQGRKLKQLSIA